MTPRRTGHACRRRKRPRSRGQAAHPLRPRPRTPKAEGSAWRRAPEGIHHLGIGPPCTSRSGSMAVGSGSVQRQPRHQEPRPERTREQTCGFACRSDAGPVASVPRGLRPDVTAQGTLWIPNRTRVLARRLRHHERKSESASAQCIPSREQNSQWSLHGRCIATASVGLPGRATTSPP